MTEAEPVVPTTSKTNYWPTKIWSFDGLVVLMNAAGTVMIILIMLMICTDVTSRYVFNKPLAGVTELTQVFIVGIVFLQLAHATRLGKLTRSDGAYELMLAKVPWLGHSLGAIFDFSGAMLLSIIVYGAFPKLIAAWTNGFYFGSVGFFTFPEWPIWALLLAGSIVTTIQFLLFGIHHVRGAIQNKPEVKSSGEQQ